MVSSTLSTNEWLKIREASQYAGWSRALLYNLIKSGAIKSFVRKTHPWNKSGTRLVSRSSIDEYLRRQALEQGALPDNREVVQ
jgi:predicted DNA-binding transcriptional regulator AlpA